MWCDTIQHKACHIFQISRFRRDSAFARLVQGGKSAVEIVGWWEKPKYAGALAIGLPMVKPLKELPEHEQVTVRIEVPDESTAGMLGGLYGLGLTHRTRLRCSAPIFRLTFWHPMKAEKHLRHLGADLFSPDVLKAEIQDALPPVGAGRCGEKCMGDADEFLNLDGTDSDDPFDWIWNLRQFLNKWGLWQYGLGYYTGMMSTEMPGFAVVFPHQLRVKRNEYRKALEHKERPQVVEHGTSLEFLHDSSPALFSGGTVLLRGRDSGHDHD